MTAPLAWLVEAFIRRDQLMAEGVPIQLSVSSFGVSIWTPDHEIESMRAWSLLERAKSNPLMPSIETVAAKYRKAMACKA